MRRFVQVVFFLFVNVSWRLYADFFDILSEMRHKSLKYLMTWF